MSDLTPELNLALCLDADDTADYLTTNAGLRGSLNTIDGLFNSSTGHNHNGAHQGGNFTSLSITGDLTIGGNFTANGTLTSLGAAHFPSLNVDGASSLGSISATGAVTLNSTLNVGGTVNFSQGVTAAAVQSTGFIAAGTNVSGAAGDITANRGNNTGYIWLGNASHYLGFDGTNYVLPTSNLSVPGIIASGTLSAPSITFNQNGYFWQGIPGVAAVETNGGIVVDGQIVYMHSNRTVGFQLINGTEVSAFGFTSFNCQALNVVHNGAVNGSFYVDDGVTGVTINLRNGNYGVFNKSTRSGASAGEVAIANYLYVPGDVYAGLRMYAISFNQTSDPKLKANMTVVSDDDCMGRVRAAVPVQTYQMDMPPSDTPQPTPWEIGFSAPDVYASSPEFVTLDSTNAPVGLNYANMAALLWGALRQLDARCQAKGI
jgi:hypothetical protein